MGLVLLPLLSSVNELTIIMQFIFFAGLMFVYTHISSASPGPDNIEGQLLLKNKYLLKKLFVKFQLEMVMHSLLFGSIITSVMHFFI